MNFKNIKTIIIIIAALTFTIGFARPARAEKLESENYEIENVTIDGGGEVLTGTNLNILSTIGDPTADARLVSGSYELKSGFPNGILANVPKITCFETTTNGSNSTCQYLPGAWGMQGECGFNGCYDRAKIEVDFQENPIDTLYLIKIQYNSNDYYLQSDHTLGTAWDSSDLMTRCSIEGRDPNDPNCDDQSDPNWNYSLQKYNVLGLVPNTAYTASISAISGDFTQTRFGPDSTATTTNTAIAFDLDIGLVSEPSADTSEPYNVQLDGINTVAPVTSDEIIWVDMNTNNKSGMSVYVRDENNGLESASTSSTIPSESENLSTDPNNNGGYGLKTYNYTPSESHAGPLLRSANYDTAGANEVGAISTTNSLIFFTDITGTNSGGIIGGRGAVYTKARSHATHPAASDYNDTLTFIIVGNF